MSDPEKRKKLDKTFYTHTDVLKLGKDLLGCYLYSCIDGQLTSGMIIETESYKGAEDKACHAYKMRRTPRTEVMFSEGGLAYIYLCYGIHHLMNIVTNTRGIPEAILIRALQPIDGIPLMQKRRKMKKNLTSGPGTLTEALGITVFDNGTSLLENRIWIEQGEKISQEKIIASPRIGIDYAEEDALLPYRFRIKK